MGRVLSQSFITAKDSLANKPIRLHIIEDGGSGNLGAEVLRYAEYPQNVIFPTSGGYTYYASPLVSEAVRENLAQEIDQLTVSISGVDQAIIHYLENHNALRNCKYTIRTVFADLLNDATAYTDDIFDVASASLGVN